MNYTQNTKLMSITEDTLILGIDIAKNKHVARAIDFRGFEYGKHIQFENSLNGFELLINWAKNIAETNGKVKIIVGVEPTGHYWFTLAQYLKANSIELMIINPMHVKRTKEFEDNSPTKNDIKDAKVIAKLLKDGHYSIPNIPEGSYSELRNAMDIKSDIDDRLNTVKNRINRWLDRFFPEFTTVFKGITTKTAIKTLKEFPLPEEITKMSADEIVLRWRTEVKRAVGVKKAKKLIAAANNSIGLKDGNRFAKIEIQQLIEEYTLLSSREDYIMSEVKKILDEIPFAEHMLNITGIGIKTVAGFLSEIGDINNYSDGKQIIKLAGLNLKEHSSGKHKGQTRISKRGRSKLRALLFRAVMPLVSKNEDFRLLHHRLTTRERNPLKKKQSLIAIVCKLIRVLFAIGKKCVAYDPYTTFGNQNNNSSLLKIA